MRSAIAGAVAVLALAAALTGCGSAPDAPRRQLAGYLTSVNRIEAQLASPLTAVNVVDRQLAGGAGHGGAGATAAPRLTATAAERRLRRAGGEIQTLSRRLRALPAPAPAAHLKALLVELADRQANLTTQTRRLIVFIPGFSRSLRPLGPAITELERALAVNQAYGTSAVQAVYASKTAALRTFAHQLQDIQRSLSRLRPPRSSQPTYAAEKRSLRRMRTAALVLAGDLATQRTTTLANVLRSFEQAAALPASRPAQAAEAAAIRAYDRGVGQLNALAAAANRERLRLAQQYP